MKTLGLIATFFVMPFLVKAQKSYPLLLDQYMQAQVRVNDFTGAVLVAKKGKVIYKKAYGLANREWNIPNTPTTKFQIGSITKEFTAAAILQLVETGKLNLEDKLSKYFPDFPKGDNVTVHMLLNHTSGIKSYTSLPNIEALHSLSYPKDSVVALIKKLPYDFSPGARWEYSNSGYFLLGYIIEKVTGQTYGDYLLQNVFRKTGLTNTAVNKVDSVLAQRAMGYRKTPTGWQNAQHISMDLPYSAGAIISTIDDLYQWQQTLLSGKFIAPALLSKMTTPYLRNYGYGLIIDSLQNHKRIGHGGNIPGFASYSFAYPQADVHIIILSNKQGGLQGMGQALGAILFDVPVIAPYRTKNITIDAAIPNRYIGKYQFNHSVETLMAKDGKLFIKFQDNNHEFELKPESETLFFLAVDPDLKFQFSLNKEGQVKNVYAIEGGVKTEIKKLKE